MNFVRTFEFDSFGPWIIVINGRHTLPPLFKSYQEELNNSIFTFKVPRKIERRKANPHMHLYNMVVGVLPDHLLILTREDEKITEKRIALSDIRYITQSECLLNGDLLLDTPEGKTVINYNTVSGDIITTFVELIRNLIKIPQAEFIVNEIDIQFKANDILFENLFNGLKKKEAEIRLIAYQPSFYVQVIPSFWHTLKHFTRKASRLSSTMFICNNKELIVINRSTKVEDVFDSVYGYAFTYIPLANIISSQVTTSSIPPYIQMLEIKTNTNTFSYPICDNNYGIKGLVNAFSYDNIICI